MRNNMKWSNIGILLVSVALFSVNAAGIQASSASTTTQKRAPPARARIKYSVVQADKTTFSTGALVATVNGKRHVLVSKSKEKCLQIIDERDFDGDGSLDALVEDITACGGNCCPNQFFFVSAL